MTKTGFKTPINFWGYVHAVMASQVICVATRWCALNTRSLWYAAYSSITLKKLTVTKILSKFPIRQNPNCIHYEIKKTKWNHVPSFILEDGRRFCFYKLLLNYTYNLGISST